MHLGFLTPEYPHPQMEASAGIGSSIKNLVKALVKMKIEITVFVYGQKENFIFYEDGINFHLIKQQKYEFLGWYLHRRFLQNYINKIILDDRIDAVEAPDWTGITAFMKLKCHLVIRLHGSDTYFCKLENRPQKRKNFWFEKMALIKADHLLSVSKFTAEKTASFFDLKKSIKVIPNSVNVNYYRPESTPIEEGTILYFGSIVRKKGVLKLADIFNIIIKKNPEAKLIFAGKDVKDILSSTSTKQLIINKLSAAAQIKVEWLGTLPYKKVRDQIARANIVVLPSFAEALPMTWLEAMAMEKALVTSNIGWAKEVMIDGKTGFTVDPKDHELYAAKILQLMKDPELAQEMGKEARQQVIKKFSTEIVVRENICYYEKVIGGHRK